MRRGTSGCTPTLCSSCRGSRCSPSHCSCWTAMTSANGERPGSPASWVWSPSSLLILRARHPLTTPLVEWWVVVCSLLLANGSAAHACYGLPPSGPLPSLQRRTSQGRGRGLSLNQPLHHPSCPALPALGSH